MTKQKQPKKFGEEQENIVSVILWKILKGQSQKNALEIIRQCSDYIPVHEELYKLEEDIENDKTKTT